MEVHDLTFLKLAEVTKQHEIIQTILALVENAVFVPDPPPPNHCKKLTSPWAVC